MIDKHTLIKNFSKSAFLYDKYCDVQNKCARLLIEKAQGLPGAGKILEIGCGTGNYTHLLKQRFPHREILAVDICERMVGRAREKITDSGVEFAAVDGETIDCEERFILITSNCAFQWFEDMEGSIRMYRGLLMPHGRILFSTFGPLTFYELNEALAKFLEGPSSIAASGFLKMESIEALLKDIFEDVEIEKRIFKQRYTSLKDLLRSIKYTGVRGGAISNRIWLPRDIRKLEKIYIESFGSIEATYEVYFCKGLSA